MSAPPSPVDERKTDDASKPTASSKDASSLKRVREGSTEPTSTDVVPPVIPVVTKKNRTVPPTDGEPLSRKTSAETQTVGEVRKKVEEMTWREDEAKKRANGHAVSSGDKDTVSETASIKVDEEDAAAKTEGNVPLEAGWEEIGSADAEGAASEVSHKRKQLDRNDSSLGAEDALKRAKEDEAKEAPETTTESATEAKDEVKPNDAADGSPAVAAPAPVKKPQTTFSSFSSSASPFSAGLKHTSAFGSAAAQPVASSSSSPKPSAFGGYSSAFSAFAAKDKKDLKTNDKPEGSKSSFGDILKDTQEDKGNDKGDKLQMTTQDVPTGEEDEETIYQLRVKLHVMEKDGGWKERGTGPLRLNVRKSDGKGARLVMRAEGVLRLVLNVPLFVGMSCTEEGKHVRMTVIEDGEIRNLAFRTTSAKVASELYGQIHDLIPLESAGSKSPQPAGDPAAGGWDV